MDADVIIVGAGPAGSTCARLLGAAGRTVLLLDRARFPRDKPCGGWVNVKAFRTFAELEGLRRKSSPRNRLIEEPFHGLVFLSSDLTRRAEYKSRRVVGYTVLRKRFDHGLLRLAAATKGVRAIQRQDVVAADVGEKSVTVITSKGRRFEGSILVGADGANSRVARLNGLGEGWPPERLINCLCEEVRVDPRALTRVHGRQRRILISVSYRGIAGYAWAFPKRNTMGVGIGCRGGAAEGLRDRYDEWVVDLKRAGLLPEKVRASSPKAALIPAGGAIDCEQHVGKRTVLIGDAGGFVSAATGEGIYPAMLSARVAARCIDRALGARQPQDALLEFKFAWRRSFAEYIQMPNANLPLLLPLIYDNGELCKRLAECYLFGRNF